MRATFAAIILALSLQAGAAVAAATPDTCATQEEALRTEAKKACTGLSYLFNPSGCYISRKAFNSFDVDKCRADAAPAQTVAKPHQNGTPVVTVPRKEIQVAAPHGAAVPEPDLARLKAENARLKAENDRLRAELEQLKAERGAAGGTR